jgi:2-aminoadipate transaminase
LKLPEGIETAELLARARRAGVAFVPGSQFCCCGGCEDYIRLAFSLLDEGELREGAKRLAQTLTST